MTFSQVGVGTTNPKSAFDVTSTNMGVLFPRIALTDKFSTSPVINPVGGSLEAGTLIWNTSTINSGLNILFPGYYFWDGTSWVSFLNPTKVSNTSATATLAEPNISISTVSSLNVAGTNTASEVFDNSTKYKTINVSGLTGTIANVVCNVQLSHTWGGDVDLYLQSPTGQIIELSTDNGGTLSTQFNVTFTDSAPANITVIWAGGNITINAKPEGSLTTSLGVTPTITTMAGFAGGNPNGVWTLIVRDDSASDNLSYTSFSLSISTSSPAEYRLIGEASVVYRVGSDVMNSSVYSCNPNDDQGFITALTRTTTTVGSVGTMSGTLPGTVLSYASSSPKQGSGNFWATSHNQSIDTTLVDGTTYFYQLWAKVNTQTPLINNELYSLIPIQISR